MLSTDDSLDDNPPPENLLQLSLWESLNYASQPDAPLVWIEDRYISRFLNPPNLLQLQDVLIGLVDIGALSEDQHREWIDKVFKSGTGFSAPDLDTLLKVLVSTPIENGVLMETQDISEFRSALGRQQAMLSYVDWLEKRTDSEGRPMGEPRFGKYLWFLLPAILRRVWFGNELTEERRIAISNWVFDEISLDSVRSINNNVKAEARYQFVSIFIMHSILLPFFDMLQNEHQGEELYKPFLDWLFEQQLNLRLQLDQTLFDTLAIQLAEMFLKYDDLDLGADEKENKQARVIIFREIRAFVDLLPEHVTDRLYKLEGFADRIGVTRDFVLNGVWGSFTCSELTKSISEASHSHVAPIAIEKDGDKIVDTYLNLSVEDGVLTNACLSKGDKRINIDHITLMLCAPTPEVRLQLFETCRLHEVMDVRLIEQTRSMLAKDLAVTPRLNEWHTISNLSFASTLSRLENAFDNEESFLKSWLELPDLDVLANYAGFDQSNTDPSEARVAASEFLEAAYGKKEAIRRLSVLSVMLPLFPTEFGSMEVDDNDELSVFERAVINAQYANESTNSHEWLQKIEPSLQYVLEFFVFMVRTGVNAAAIKENYRSAPDWLSLSLIWIWAERITQVFFAAGVDLKKAQEMHALQSQNRFDQMLRVNNLSAAFCAGGINLSVQRVQHLMFERLTNGRETPLDITKDKVLLELIGTINGGKWTPDAHHIFEYPALAGVQAATWNLYPKWVSRGLIDPSGSFKNLGTRAIVEQILQDVDNAEEPSAPLGLFMISTSGWLDEVTLNRLFDQIASTLRRAKNRNFEASENVILHLFGRISGELNRTDEFKELLSDIVAFQYGHSEPNALPNEFADMGNDHLFAQIIEASFTHAQSKPVSIEEKITCFTGVVGHLHRIWPNSGGIVHRLLMRQAKITPVSLADPLWQLIREIRKNH